MTQMLHLANQDDEEEKKLIKAKLGEWKKLKMASRASAKPVEASTDTKNSEAYQDSIADLDGFRPKKKKIDWSLLDDIDSSDSDKAAAASGKSKKSKKFASKSSPDENIEEMERIMNRRQAEVASTIDEDDNEDDDEYGRKQQAIEKKKEKNKRILRRPVAELSPSSQDSTSASDDEEVDVEAAEEAAAAKMRDIMNKRYLALLQEETAAKGGGQDAEMKTLEKRKFYEIDSMLNKLFSVKGSVLECYNIFMEIRDKKMYNASLIESTLMAISRAPRSSATSPDSNYAITAFRQYHIWKKDNIVDPATADPSFGVAFVLSCYASNLLDSAEEIMMMLVNEKSAEMSAFLPGLMCASIIRSNSGTVDTEYKDDLVPFLNSLNKYTIGDANLVIRVLARYRLYEDIFRVFTALRESRIRPNTESMEFLSNALVATVDKGIKADSMGELPVIDAPEVVFVGRSNVGKSSLVNFLLNRKTLASTSAVPGHTQHFHFFNINSERTDLPKFTFVDVPGLGYAETVDGNQQVSWRSLIQRYLSKRSTLKVVCHLIDSRHKVTATDQEMFEIFLQAVSERRENNEEQFIYAIVLTKVDKVSKKVLNLNVKHVNKVATQIMDDIANRQEQSNEETVGLESDDTQIVPATTPATTTCTTTADASGKHIQIILSSARSKEGADDIWKLVQGALA